MPSWKYTFSSLFAAVFLTACSAVDGPGDISFGGTGGTVSEAGVGGAVDVGGSGGVGGGVVAGTGGSLAGAGGGDPNDCGGTTTEAGQLDIYIMFDDSFSMQLWGIWEPAVEAVRAFVNDPRSEGIGVGLQFFGPSSQCDPAHYAMPRVPIAPLPGNANAIMAAFPGLPFNSTPTLPALQGAIQHARARAVSHPASKVVVLLVTDGQPSNCMSTNANVAEAAAEGFSGNGGPSIQTYVLGLAGVALNQVAASGGTGQAIVVDSTASEDILAAMENIRGQALPCDYALPAETEDKDLVNLEVTPNGGTPVTIPRVDSPDLCDPANGGWYYDDSDDPKRLIACDASCNFLRSSSGRTRVKLGCPVFEGPK